MNVPYALIGVLALMGVFTVPILGVPSSSSQNVVSVSNISVAGTERVVISIDLTTDQDLSLFRFELPLTSELCDIIGDRNGDGAITGTVVGANAAIATGQDIVVRRAGRVTDTPQETLFACTDGRLIAAVLSLTGATVIPRSSGPVFTIEFDVQGATAQGCVTLTPENIQAKRGPLAVETVVQSGEFCIRG